MTQLSLHGVDFTEMGVSSELVKSTLIGSLVGLLTWLTPQHFVSEITNAIVFCKSALAQWRAALIQPEGK